MSFGAERPFVLRDAHFNPRVEQTVIARHGSAVVLSGETNLNWWHSVVSQDQQHAGANGSVAHGGASKDRTEESNHGGDDVRVSLTFRKVVTFVDDENKLYGKGADHDKLDWPFEDKGKHRLDGNLESEIR